MSKNIKIYNKKRDSFIPFFKFSGLVCCLGGAVTAIFNPIVGVVEFCAGLALAVYGIYESYKFNKQENTQLQNVKDIVIEEYKQTTAEKFVVKSNNIENAKYESKEIIK